MGKKIVIGAVIASALLATIIIGINFYVQSMSRHLIISREAAPTSQTILVLGAAVYRDGRLSDMYHDRAQTALDLYNAGKSSVILVSGDNSTKEYDEVTPVKKYLIAAGVPSSSIVLDYAGFDTYDSLYRARNIFGVTSTIIVTQNFHLPRALYIGKKLGISVYGVNADLRTYGDIRYLYLREYGARIKAWLNSVFRSKPKFLGEKITIPA